MDSFREDEFLVRLARSVKGTLIAIDAPLSLPRGMDCLEETCHCQAISRRGVRECELALRAKGIGCFYTTKRSIIKRMVYRAIAIKETLNQWDIQVIEVYPYATKVALWGKNMPKKTTGAGVEFLRRKVKALFLETAVRISSMGHDQLDAVMAAHTGYLFAQGHAEALGNRDEGVIYAPSNLGLASLLHRRIAIVSSRCSASKAVTGEHPL